MALFICVGSAPTSASLRKMLSLSRKLGWCYSCKCLLGVIMVYIQRVLQFVNFFQSREVKREVIENHVVREPQAAETAWIGISGRAGEFERAEILIKNSTTTNSQIRFLKRLIGLTSF